MTDPTNHVLAAFNEQGEPFAYLSESDGWISNLRGAIYFTSKHDADDYLRSNHPVEIPGPVRSVCISDDNDPATSPQNPTEPSEIVRLHTGIYG